MLPFIPGLADTFIYFNDDFFLNAPSSPQDWVLNNGNIVMRGRMRTTKLLRAKNAVKKFKNRIRGVRTPLQAHFKTAQVKSAQIIGLNRYLEVHHTPHAVRKQTLLDYYASNPCVLKREISYKFRSIDQFLPIGLANHLEISDGKADVRPVGTVAYIKDSNPDLDDKHIQWISEDKTAFGCIQSLDCFPKVRADLIHAIMKAKFEGFLPEGFWPIAEPHLAT